MLRGRLSPVYRYVRSLVETQAFGTTVVAETTNQIISPPPQLQLPDGKQSVFEGSPIRKLTPEEEAAGAPDLQELTTQLLVRLVEDVQLLDLWTTFLIFTALSFGLIDTRRRWLEYGAEFVSWTLYSLQPTSVNLGRQVSSSPEDANRARASSSAARQLGGFLSVARSADQLRAQAAASRALAKDSRLAPLVEAITGLVSESVIDQDAPLPSLDGVWNCKCDYFANGNLEDMRMRIEGEAGEYIMEGRRHRLSDIVARRDGASIIVTFRWTNRNGDKGSGSWMLSKSGDFLDGGYSEDGVTAGPWRWRATKIQDVGGITRPDKVSQRAADMVASAVMEVAQLVSQETPPSREKLAQAWDSASPGTIDGTYADSAVLRDRWLAAGAELRLLLGLTASELIPANIQSVALGLTVSGLAIVSFFIARVLAVGLGSNPDAATWATFLLLFALVIEGTVKSRRESLSKILQSPEERAYRERRFAALCKWADAGGLVRSGGSLRAEVHEAVRRNVPEFRMPSGGQDDESLPSDADIEKFLRVWHPGLRRRVERSLPSVTQPGESRSELRRRQESDEASVVVIIYENLSVPEGRSIWR